MQLARKRFRIEEGGRPRVGTAAPRYSVESRELGEQTAGRRTHRIPQLSAELSAMREAISDTKREIAELQQPPGATKGIQRAACELDAVTAATERAATTILGAVEEIELSANLLISSGQTGRNEHIAVILDRVLVLYEACNFQDITGQRIRKVVSTLKFLEQRLERMTVACAGTAPLAPATAPPAKAGPALSGPALPDEPGHVSQADVDAYFI